MRRILLLLTAIALNIFAASAQSWQMITSQPETYYFGEGWGDSADEADKEALQALLSQIKLNISVSTKQEDKYARNGDIVADNTFFESTFNSYGQATLENTFKIDLSKSNKFHVGRYIKRTDVEKLWEGRRKKIHEMVNSALEAEEKGKVDVALRNYYWALALLQTMQRSGSEQYMGHTLMPWLHEQINTVLTDISISQLARKEDDVELMFTFRGKPATSLDFRFNDGGFISALSSVKDGYGVIELTPGDNPTAYNLIIEYDYKNQTRHDPELQSVMAVLDLIPFPKSAIKVRATDSSTPKQTPNVISTGTAANSFTTISPEVFKRPEESTSGGDLSKSIDAVIVAIRSKRPAEVKDLFDEETFVNFTKLVRYGNAKILGSPEITYMPFDGNTWARGLRLSLSFRNGVRKSFTEPVVFTFNNTGKIINISFGLGQTAEDDIMGRGVYPENIRKIIVDFIQNYQTAFALKRIDYIEKIFDDNALIIVGKVLRDSKDTSLNDNIRMSSGKRYQYNRLTKKEYISNLRHCFNSNEYVNLRFNKVQVRKARTGGEIYGIQLEQDYYSSTYSDHGYLFLEVNLNDPNEPLILVRTWQPEPDPDFGLYDIENFRIDEIIPY